MPLIEQSRELIATNGWRGLIISGAPKEALNPGMWEQVSAALNVPVTLALRSSVAALKAFSAQKILLMTPVDDRLKKMYYDYLAAFEIESFYPPQILRAHTDAQKLTSSEVEEMTRKALSEYPNVDAIYFQGALLDPIPILEKLEHELKLPIVASNPAMLWLVLSKLGLTVQHRGLRQTVGLLAGRASGTVLVTFAPGIGKKYFPPRRRARNRCHFDPWEKSILDPSCSLGMTGIARHFARFALCGR